MIVAAPRFGFDDGKPVARPLLLALGAALYLAVAPGAALAQTDPGARCDALAANPEDPAKPRSVLGVLYDGIDAPQAITACTTAIAAKPEEARYHFQIGRAYEKSGDEKKAMLHYKFAAQRGYKIAMRNIGFLYLRKINKNNNEIKEMMRWSLASGFSDSLTLLAIGIGYEFVNNDYVNAAKYYLRAAKPGEALAQNNLGRLYWNGWGVTKNAQEAIKWWKLAAAQGQQDAIENLRMAQRRGSGGYSGGGGSGGGGYRQPDHPYDAPTPYTPPPPVYSPPPPPIDPFYGGCHNPMGC
ncbi:tetratricopeptide repeat protein [Zavarzinia aquatilis]|nr:tetratricopeptide repeat protein [Zavarzinia aquatilis]